MPNDFNFFKVLEKDNKELIHSAFISYLFSCNNLFRDNLLKVSNIEFCKPLLERSYNISKKLKGRIDIEIISNDKKHIILIENKFKSFPDKYQLDNYDKIFKKTYLNNQSIHKYLFCFDKSLIKFEHGWTVLDYNDLLKFTETNFNTDESIDEKIFRTHYCNFLREYIDEYKRYMLDSRKLFLEDITNDKKFWLKLVYSNLHLKFIDYLSDEVVCSVNSGNATIPFLDIIPPKWTINNNKLLIQLQRDDLKFYIYSNDKNLIESIIEEANKDLKYNKMKFKKIDKKPDKSSYIFKIKISENIDLDQKLDVDTLFLLLKKFYDNIDLEIVKNFNLNPKFT